MAGRLISVVVTVFDRPQYFVQALRSISAQNDPDWEIVLVDDGGFLDLSAATAEFGNRLRVVRGPGAGPGRARNVGVGQARGEWLLFLDDDDRLCPTALAELRAAAESQPGVSWAAGRFEYIDANGDCLPQTPAGRFSSGDIYRDMIRGCQVGPPSVVLVRRSVFEAQGGFAEGPEWRFCEDYDLWLAVSRDHVIAAPNVVVAQYRIHGAQATAHWRVAMEGTLRVLEKHRLRARPGFEADFARAWAQACLDFGDGLYLQGENRLARTYWSKASAANPAISRLGLRYRRLKSFVPRQLLDVLRRLKRPSRSLSPTP